MTGNELPLSMLLRKFPRYKFVVRGFIKIYRFWLIRRRLFLFLIPFFHLKGFLWGLQSLILMKQITWSISLILLLLNTLPCMKWSRGKLFILDRVEYNFFLARILQYPSLGNLYLIIDPSYPFNATIRLYNSVLPLVVPTVEFHLKDFLMRYILPSSRGYYSLNSF